MFALTSSSNAVQAAFQAIPGSTITVFATDGVYLGTAPVVRVQLSSAGPTAGPLDGRSVLLTVGGASIEVITQGDGSVVRNLGSLRLSAGQHTVTATFAGDLTHSGSTASAPFTVLQATPVINWTPPAFIVQGTPLSAVQLNATAFVPGSASLPGEMTYSSPAGTVLNVGTHTLSVTFTPADSVNFQTVRATRTITVRAPVQAIVTGKASFLSQAGVGTLMNFEDQPANTPLAADAYRAHGVTIDHLDGWPIYVGQWASSDGAMIVPSGTKAISSSFAGVSHTAQFLSTCAPAAPSCGLFRNDVVSNRVRFTFATPVKAAGLHLGHNDKAGITVTWFDGAGGVISANTFLPFTPSSDFVGLVNASTPIASMIVETVAISGDAVYFDDLLFVAAAAGEHVAAWGSPNGTGFPAAKSNTGAVRGSDGKLLRAVVAVSAGANHSLALHADRTVSAWGQNESGQLGDGTTTPRAQAVPVTGLRNIIAVAAGSEHSLALDANGNVWSWGNNRYGQLGDGSTAQRLVPAPIVASPFNRIVIVAIAASDHSLAVAADGSLWTWGNNSNGQLGDNTTANGLTPRPAAGINRARAVSAGASHSLLLMIDGLVYAAGHNGSGQLGSGGIVDLRVWSRVGALSDVTAISAGGEHSVALRADRTVWSWGSNDSGQLGHDTTPTSLVPLQVPSLSAVTGIAAGGDHTLAVAEERIVWAWGSNAAGQLGDRTLANSSVPVRVLGPDGNLLRASQVDAGASHSLSISAFRIEATLSDAALTFPTTLIGDTSAQRRVQVLNTGDADLVLGDIATVGDFELFAEDCPAGIDAPLAPGEGCLISVVFHPSDVGLRSGRLTVYSDVGNPHVIQLTGEGVNDNTAPMVSFVESPEPVNGWHRAEGSVTVTMTATDDKSGIASLAYASTGAEPRDEVNEPGGQLSISRTIEIAAEGVTTVTALANDAVGNVSARVSHTVRIDRTAPTVEIREPRDGGIYLTGSRPLHDFACGDALSTISICSTPSTNDEYFDTLTAGTKTFSVRAMDVAGNVTTTTVAYIVNTPPTALDARLSVDEDSAGELEFAAAADPDSTTLTYVIVAGPQNGRIGEMESLGGGLARVTYAPAANFYGTDEFTFMATDGVGRSQPATVYITVRPVNDRPAVGATPDGLTYVEGGAPLLIAEGAAFTDPDFTPGRILVSMTNAADADVLWVLSSTNVVATNGEIVFDGQAVATYAGGTNGVPLEITFNAAASIDAVQAVINRLGFHNGSRNPSTDRRSISLVVSDGEQAASDPATIGVAIQAVNDAPEAAGVVTPAVAEATSAAGARVQLDATGSTDPDDTVLTFEWLDVTTGDLLARSSSAAVPLSLGDHSITLTVSDPDGLTSSTSLRVSVLDRTAPTIAVADVTTEATSAAGAVVIFDVAAADAVDGSPTIVAQPASGSTFPLGTTTVMVTATDRSGNSATRPFTVTVRDTTAPAITMTSPTATTYTLNQLVIANYSCSDSASGVDTCRGNVPSGLPIDTTRAGKSSFTVTATDRALPANTASQTTEFTVGYGIKTLHDDRRSVRSGATMPIKLQLVDFLGLNQSGSGVTLIADEIVLVSTEASYEVQDAGNANPDFNFRYDAWTRTYMFNLKTTGLVSGVHALYFHVEGDPTTRYSVRFQVR